MESINDLQSVQKYAYEHLMNIEEEIVNENLKNCYIFFSSNGLFRGKSGQEFKDEIIEKDHFEWKSIVAAMKKRKRIGKVIYVRDIYQWYYMNGINSNYTSIAAVVEYLKAVTAGYRITTMGVSSGGYMSAICGCMLGAERIFSISGQFDISGQVPEVILYKFKEINPQFVNLGELLKVHGNIPIYYFCPVNCEADYEQYQIVKKMSNVRCFLFPDKIHAATVYPFNFPDILYLSNEKLNRLAVYYDGRLINKNLFLIKTLSFSGMVNILQRAVKSKMNIKVMKRMWDIK